MHIQQDTKAKTLSYNLTDDVALIDKNIYEELETNLLNESIVRLSLHKNASELTQSMIIAIRDDTVIKQHKNITKDKIYHIIKGSIKFTLHNANSYIVKENEIFKLGKNQFASMRALSKIAIYNEIIAGPFSSKDTIYL
ncbi:WbuC family cupin fold metalloprotein [Sulfurimonas sp.]